MKKSKKIAQSTWVVRCTTEIIESAYIWAGTRSSRSCYLDEAHLTKWFHFIIDSRSRVSHRLFMSGDERREAASAEVGLARRIFN